jgi:hypothetical protein
MTQGTGDRILAEKRRAAAQAADDRAYRIVIGVAVGIFLAIALGGLVWGINDFYDEQVAIERIQATELMHRMPVESADEIRQQIRRLQDQTGMR